jgi:hypothetical protein
MIGRDLLRWGFNLVVGPPLGFVLCVATMMLLLILSPGGESQSRIDGAMIFALFAAPFVVVSHLFGLLPALLTSLLGSILDRLLRASRSARLIGALVAGALAAWLGAWWLFGQDYAIKVGSQDQFYLAIVIGGAVAALLCALLVELIAPIRPAVVPAREAAG